MPPKVNAKSNESAKADVCWTLASEEAKVDYIKQYGYCNNIHLPSAVYGATGKTNDQLINESDNTTEDTFDIFIADGTLHTTLRIHEENEEFLFSATKSKTNIWPWLVASRSLFLHYETLSILNIGNKTKLKRQMSS